ncbi:exo-alpha-sialidase [candidate division WOR-3 bacterium]|nr:exo-alpha-sialidase [candidate division WOR-3 bacterium]
MRPFNLMFTLVITAVPALAQWEGDVRLTNNPAASLTSFPCGRCLAASGSVLHAVWYDYRDGSGDIYYKRSTDNGSNWESDTRLTTAGDSSEAPAVAAGGQSVHVVWANNTDLQIRYRRSTDGGSNWANAEPLTIGSTYTLYPSVAVAGDNVHVVWIDARPATNYLPEVYYRRSTDGGATWQGEARLSTGQSSTRQPAIAVAGDLVHVVWDDGRHGLNAEIYYRRSTDGGATWQSETRFTDASGSSFNGVVAAAEQHAYAAWDDNRDGNWEIYCKRSTDAGANWGADTRLTSNQADSYFASIAAVGNCVHITWEDARDANLEEYYKRSTDYGQNWGDDTRLTNSTGHSSYSTVAVSGAAVHVLWHDNRDGNWEIYYKRNLTAGGVEEHRRLTADGREPSATIVRGVLRVPVSLFTIHYSLFDMTGRRVMALAPGPNDVSHLAPGVYFICPASGAARYTSSVQRTSKVIVNR